MATPQEIHDSLNAYRYDLQDFNQGKYEGEETNYGLKSRLFTDCYGDASPFVSAASGTGATVGQKDASSVDADDDGEPGVIYLDLGTTTSGAAGLKCYAETGAQGPQQFACRLRIDTLSTVSEEYALLVGIWDDASDISPDEARCL